MLLIVLIAGELVLSGAIARQRFGAAPISETAEELASQESLFVGVMLANDPRRQPKAAAASATSQEKAGAAT